MLAYSARKNKANGPAAYSTLNPETNSDSPSVRSNGARFVSARVETYHIMASGQHEKIRYRGSWVIASVFRVYPPLRRMIDSRIIARVTSYEIVWATARSAPIKAYFEFEAHPDHRMEYTARLDIASMKSSPRLRSARENGMGSGVQMEIARIRASIGVVMNRIGEDVDGRIGSFTNNFTPSANGWSSPNGPTTFGPFRPCM